MYLQGKGGNLSEQQANFANDIQSSFQMLQEIDQWDKQYRGAPASPSKVGGPPQ